MGGYIALNLLRRHPARLSGLVLANTRATGDTPAAKHVRGTQAQAVRDGGMQDLRDEMLSKLLGQSTVASAPDVLRSVEDMLLQATAEGSAGMLGAMAERPDSTQALRDTALPIAIVAGAEDTLIPLSEAEAMHEAAPQSELTIVPNAGHLCCLERPVRFNTIIRSFVQTHILM